MTYDARALANHFLDRADATGKEVTIMSLLKIIYFAHGWHFVKHNAPLVKNQFEAWKLGPVIRVVYDSFKEFGDRPVTKRAFAFDPVEQQKRLCTADFPPGIAIFLDNIFDAYSNISAFKLSDMTHEEGSPWHQVWHSEGKVVPGMVIPDTAIRNYFQQSDSIETFNKVRA